MANLAPRPSLHVQTVRHLRLRQPVDGIKASRPTPRESGRAPNATAAAPLLQRSSTLTAVGLPKLPPAFAVSQRLPRPLFCPPFGHPLVLRPCKYSGRRVGSP